MKHRVLGWMMAVTCHLAAVSPILAQGSGSGSGSGGTTPPPPAPPPSGAGFGSNPVIWAAGLFAAALVLFGVELMLPTGGLIFFVSLLMTIGGIVALFQVSPEYGLIGIAVTLGSIPFLFAAAIRVLPDTPIFRLMTLKDRGPDGMSPVGDASTEAEVVGAEAEVVSTLRPSGTVMLDGERRSAVSVVGEIAVGERVVVISADGLGLRVRRAQSDQEEDSDPEV